MTTEIDYLKFIKDQKLFIGKLRERIYKVEDASLSYRLIHTWESDGIFDSQRTSEKQWRRLSLIDLIWLMIVVKLRAFGVPKGIILEAKNSLLVSPSGEEWYTLDFGIWQVTKKHEQVGIVIGSDGKARVGSEGEIDYLRNKEGLSDFIYIDFTAIVKEVVSKEEAKKQE